VISRSFILSERLRWEMWRVKVLFTKSNLTATDVEVLLTRRCDGGVEYLRYDNLQL
jgi:hypothetical protein